MLFRQEAFERLTDQPWDESHVRKRLQALVDAADNAFDPDRLWPAHAGDVWDAMTPPPKNLFVGAAGIVYALDALRRRIGLDVRTDLVRAIERTLELTNVRSDVAALEDVPQPGESSLFIGETGILLTAWSLTRDAAIADRLLARVRESRSNDANELMWGIPGALLAARAMYRWTSDERWRNAADTAAQELRARRDADGLWTQHFPSRAFRYVGPIHGAVGNELALLDDDVAANETLVETLTTAAVFEDGAANWPPAANGNLVGRDGQIRLQWCHGAPGIVASAMSYLPLELVLAGAEATWRAGPHGPEKGAGICHGTAGNGYALLKTFERTGDELWRERARRFAVHALEQTDRQSPLRYSLFTGALGVALFAADCINARARFPVVDGFAD